MGCHTQGLNYHGNLRAPPSIAQWPTTGQKRCGRYGIRIEEGKALLSLLSLLHVTAANFGVYVP